MTIVDEGGGRGALRARRLGGRGWGAAAAGVFAASVALLGCSGSQHAGEELAEGQPVASGGGSGPGSGAGAADMRDPRELSDLELLDVPGVLELSAARLVQELGVLGFLEAYIIDIPPTARFITDFEISRAWSASSYIAGNDQATSAFESDVFYFTRAATSSLLEEGGSRVLHYAFFEALEECARDSRWPEVELFVIADGRGYDVFPEIIEPTFGMSYYEFQELKHECARYAVTYPSLDEATRDELLAPQREHYSRAIVDALAASPHVEVPARYRAEWDELVAQGW